MANTRCRACGTSTHIIYGHDVAGGIVGRYDARAIKILRHKLTASCLNSGVKLRRGWPMRHLPSLIMHGRCPQNQGKTTLAGIGLSGLE